MAQDAQTAPKADKTQKAEILLDAGTNELEVLVFTLAGQQYGINVAKLYEIVLPGRVNALPDQHPAIEGAFPLRGRAVPLVGLRRYLGLTPPTEEEISNPQRSRVLVTEFNGQVTAFRVDAVHGIQRVSSTDMDSLPRLKAFRSVPVTSILHLGDQLLLMLDFETIHNRLTGGGMRLPESCALKAPTRAGRRVVIAEDSITVQRMMVEALKQSGYPTPRAFDNGRLAWEWLQNADPSTVDLVLTDIEMPQIDGLHLCKLIRSERALRHLPVVIFSSLVSDENRRKGQQVGATAQIAKPDLPRLVEVLDELFLKMQQPPQPPARPSA